MTLIHRAGYRLDSPYVVCYPHSSHKILWTNLGISLRKTVDIVSAPGDIPAGLGGLERHSSARGGRD